MSPQNKVVSLYYFIIPLIITEADLLMPFFII